jgi:multiple sugar transport system substrate-binding protein
VGTQQSAGQDGPRRVPWSASIAHRNPAAGLPSRRGRCAPGQSLSSKSESGGPVTLRVSTWGNDSRLKLTQQAVDAFTAANPDIKVTVENNDWSAYWDKLATMTAGGNSPDVIQMGLTATE